MSISVSERLKKRRESKSGRSSFDEDVDAPVIDVKLEVDGLTREKIKKREQAAFLPYEEKVKVFADLKENTSPQEEDQYEKSLEVKAYSKNPIPLKTSEDALYNDSLSPAREHPASPLIDANLEKTSIKLREESKELRDNLEKTSAKPRDNLETTTPFVQIQTTPNYLPLFHEIKVDDNSNLEISSRKLRENIEKTRRKLRDNLEIGNTQPSDNLENQLQQLRDKPREIPREILEKTSRMAPRVRFSILVGLQRKITLYIYFETVKAQDTITEAITSFHLAQVTNTTVLNAQNSIKELIKKEVMGRAEFKNGRGGWTRYELAQAIFQEIHALDITGKLRDNLETTWRKPGEEPRDKPRENSLSSSSNLNTNTTETKETDPNKPALPEEWKTGLDWSALEKFFGQVSVNEKTGVYRAQLGLPTNIALQDSPPLTLDDIQNSIDKMTWDYESKVYTADSTYMTRSRLFGVLMKRGHYNAQAPGFKTRKARQAEQRLRELEEETKVLKAVQDSQFELVQMKWIQTQNLAEIRTKHPIYKIAINDERLLGMVKSHFRQQNYSKVVMENITDHTKLGIDFSLIDQ